MISIKKYSHKMRNIWDEFISISNNGTIFHKQSFLNYHIDRKFIDSSLMFYYNKKLVAVFPACSVKLSGKQTLYSHLGASFGGIVLLPDSSFALCKKIISSLEKYCKRYNFSSVIMINTPLIYYTQKDDTLNYLLLRNNYGISEKYISHYIDLRGVVSTKGLFNKRKRRYLSGLLAEKRFIITKDNNFDGFFKLLLASKKSFRTSPTHSCDEIKKLHANFSSSVLLFITKRGSACVGGTLVFITSVKTCLVFYNIVKAKYKNSHLALLQLYYVINYVKEKKYSLVDLGVSHTPEAKDSFAPKLSLINFKEQLGGRGAVRIVYKKNFS